MNLRSVYREIQFAETRDRIGGPSSKAFEDEQAELEGRSQVPKKLANSIGNQNLSKKFESFQEDLNQVSNLLNKLIDDCEVKLAQTLD